MSFDLSRRYALIESSAFVYSVAAKISSNCACVWQRAGGGERECGCAALLPCCALLPLSALLTFCLRTLSSDNGQHESS